MTEEELPLYFARHLINDDLPLIHHSWSKAIHEVSPNCFIDKQRFYPIQNKLINDCLQKYHTLILALTDDPETIIGYLNYSFFHEILVINWLYIKNIYRKNGIAADILEKLYPGSRTKIIILTQFSKYFNQLQDKFNLHYDPYFLTETL